MDFTLKEFVNQLRQQMYIEFPTFNGEYANQFGYMQTNNKKHPNRELHIKNVAFMYNQPMIINDNMIIFDIGNEQAERDYPYYHILEDSQVIRKRNRSNKYTKGSQDEIKDKGKRDYAIVTFNGKTFSKQYTKNVRGMRKNVINRAAYSVGKGKERKMVDTFNSDSYINKHYHYLENMANKINPMLAGLFGLEYVGTRSGGLGDDYVIGGDDTLEFFQGLFSKGE